MKTDFDKLMSIHFQYMPTAGSTHRMSARERRQLVREATKTQDCNRCKDLQSSDGPDCAGSSPVGAVWESDKEYSTVEKRSHEFTQGGQLMSFSVIGIL